MRLSTHTVESVGNESARVPLRPIFFKNLRTSIPARGGGDRPVPYGTGNADNTSVFIVDPEQ